MERCVQPPGSGDASALRTGSWEKTERACADGARDQHRRGDRGLGRGEARSVAAPKAALRVAAREKVGGSTLP